MKGIGRAARGLAALAARWLGVKRGAPAVRATDDAAGAKLALRLGGTRGKPKPVQIVRPAGMGGFRRACLRARARAAVKAEATLRRRWLGAQRNERRRRDALLAAAVLREAVRRAKEAA